MSNKDLIKKFNFNSKQMKQINKAGKYINYILDPRLSAREMELILRRIDFFKKNNMECQK